MSLMLQRGVESDILQIMDLKRKKGKMYFSLVLCRLNDRKHLHFDSLRKLSAAQRSLLFLPPLSLEIMYLLPRIKRGKHEKSKHLIVQKAFYIENNYFFTQIHCCSSFCRLLIQSISWANKMTDICNMYTNLKNKHHIVHLTKEKSFST